MFLEFANFYQWFIQGFRQIATPYTSILKNLNKFLADNLILIGKNTVIDRVDKGSKISKIKNEVKCYNKKIEK